MGRRAIKFTATLPVMTQVWRRCPKRLDDVPNPAIPRLRKKLKRYHYLERIAIGEDGRQYVTITTTGV